MALQHAIDSLVDRGYIVTQTSPTTWVARDAYSPPRETFTIAVMPTPNGDRYSLEGWGSGNGS